MGHGKALLATVSLLISLTAPVAGADQTFDASKPHHLTSTGDGTLFLWTRTALSVVPKGRPPQPVALQAKIIRRVVPRPVDKAFVVVENTIETESGWSPEHTVHLMDEAGVILESWRMPENVLDIVAPGRRAYALTSNGLVRLDPKGGKTKLNGIEPWETQLLADPDRHLIICKANDERESAHVSGYDPRAGCRSDAGWTFIGSWGTVQPVLCGEWLVEPVQQEWRTLHTEKIRVRSTKDARLMAEVAYRSTELRCANDHELWDTSGQKLIDLPNMAMRKSVRCEKGLAIAMTSHEGVTVCLDDKGRIGSLSTSP